MVVGTHMTGLRSRWTSSRSYTSSPSSSPSPWCEMFSYCSNRSCQEPRTQEPRGNLAGRTLSTRFLIQVNIDHYHSCLLGHKSWWEHCSWQELSTSHTDSPAIIRRKVSSKCWVGAYLVLVFLLGVEGPPVTFTVPLVFILVPTGVGRQQSTQQSQAEERLRGGDWLGGGESIHQETEAACQHHDLQQQQPLSTG